MDTFLTSSLTPTSSESSFIESHIGADVRDLALRLKAAEDFRPKYVLQQIAGRQAMRRKMPVWAENPRIVYPVHLSVEQCSSEATANYKRGIVERFCTDISGKMFADLTGGFGVDFSVMSARFSKAFYVERNADLCAIAEHNFKALGIENHSIVNGDGADFIKKSGEHFGVVFIDPARRDSAGGKTVHVQDCEPNILDFQDVLMTKTDIAIIKLSPMLDISECLLRLKNIREIHVLAVDGECKEMLVVLTAEKNDDEPKIFAVNDSQIFSFLRSREQNCAAKIAGRVSEGMYLYEPNAAIMKAAPFNLLSECFSIRKVARNSHLYVSTDLVDDFPGRTFRIVRVGSVKDFKNIEKANIAVRNFPLRADELRKKLKIKDGGDVYIFATTLFDGSKVLMETGKV